MGVLSPFKIKKSPSSLIRDERPNVLRGTTLIYGKSMLSVRYGQMPYILPSDNGRVFRLRLLGHTFQAAAPRAVPNVPSTVSHQPTAL